MFLKPDFSLCQFELSFRDESGERLVNLHGITLFRVVACKSCIFPKQKAKSYRQADPTIRLVAYLTQS